MPGYWIDEPHPNGVRECRNDGTGAWTWRDERVRTWQETDEEGNPLGPPEEKHYDWVDSGEPCEPGT